MNWDKYNQEILQKLDIESEVEALGIRIFGQGGSGWLVCHAIDREDKNPSAAVCVDSSHRFAGRYKDHGGNGDTLSFWELAVRLGHFSDWREAQKHYADQVGVKVSDYRDVPSQKNKQSVNHRHPIDQIETLNDQDEFYQQQIELWSKTKPPITPESVKESGAKLVKWPKGAPEPFLCLAVPARNIQYEITGLILYRVDGKDFPGTNGSKSKKTIITKGSHDGWVLIGGKERFQNASVIWKVEGVPDALALHSHLPEDHVVVTNICGAMSAANCFPELFQGKVVYAIGDADEPGQKGVESFAQAIREKAESIRIVPLSYEVTEKHGKDVRDFFHENHSFEELLEFADQAEPVQYAWPELVPLGNPELPSFPVDALPEVLREWVIAESEETQTPADLAGLLALSVCAATLARKVEVQGSVNWREPVNLFVAVLLEPANRKSAVFSDATRPLRIYERELIDEKAPEYKEALQRQRQLEKRLKILEDKAAKSGDEDQFQEAAELARELDAIPEPVLPSLIVDDVTSEKLGMILDQQGGRIAQISRITSLSRPTVYRLLKNSGA